MAENESIDELRDTAITLSCYRETHRLDRLLRVFHKALALARTEQRDTELLTNLVGLHDRKGVLTVGWRDAESGLMLHPYVDEAWEAENEALVAHYGPDCVPFYQSLD